MQISDLCACFYIRNGGRIHSSNENSVTDEHEHQAPSGVMEQGLRSLGKDFVSLLSHQNDEYVADIPGYRMHIFAY